jgi:hypothetical protein
LRDGVIWWPGGLSTEGVERSLDGRQLMVEVVTRRGIHLCGGREPEPERDLSGRDEHVEIRKLLVG